MFDCLGFGGFDGVYDGINMGNGCVDSIGNLGLFWFEYFVGIMELIWGNDGIVFNENYSSICRGGFYCVDDFFEFFFYKGFVDGGFVLCKCFLN